MNALLKMEDFENLLQRKPAPSERARESVEESQREAFRRRHPDAVFRPPFAAAIGNFAVVSEKEKRRLDLCRYAIRSVKQLNP